MDDRYEFTLEQLKAFLSEYCGASAFDVAAEESLRGLLESLGDRAELTIHRQ